MGDSKKSSGCGPFTIYAAMFRRRSSTRSRRCSSTSSLPRSSPPEPRPAKRKTGSDDSSVGVRHANPLAVPATFNSKSKSVVHANQLAVPATFNSKSKSVVPVPRKPVRAQPGQMKQLPSPHVPVSGNGISGELETMLYDYQKTKGNSKLVRATSGNVMLYGNLGNIRSKQSSNNDPKPSYRLNANRVTGNLVSKSQTDTDTGTVVLCRALSKRMDSEELKDLGNREFGEGRFAEALAYYDQAISMDPAKASYRSNKAAALMGLGRIFEAVCECKEAVRMDPGYYRAHNRLAGLYFRLGEAGKAIHHYRQSQREADPSDISKAQTLQKHIAKCSEARRTRDWQTMLKESQSAISFGADFALQVFSWKAEALMRLQKQDEADTVLNGEPELDVNASTRIFGAPVSGYILMIRAQVDMAAGRFDEAVSAAQRAMQLDRNNREITTILRRTKAVAFARTKGNEFFKASNFNEACLAYGEGLGHDPQNTILLCNRAASRAKLAQWERAAEDCNAALMLRPSYAKARLRRAHCNAKMGRWAPAVQDYEMLIKEVPGDEEVSKALAEAKSMMQRKRGDIVKS